MMGFQEAGSRADRTVTPRLSYPLRPSVTLDAGTSRDLGCGLRSLELTVPTYEIEYTLSGLHQRQASKPLKTDRAQFGPDGQF
jgi:hypothetical protein